MSSPLQNWAKMGLNIPIVNRIAKEIATIKGRDPSNIEDDINKYWNPHQVNREVNNIKQQTGVDLGNLFDQSSSNISQEQINCVKYLAKQYILGNLEYEDITSIIANQQSVILFQKFCQDIKVEYDGPEINNPTLRKYLKNIEPEVINIIFKNHVAVITAVERSIKSKSVEVIDLSKKAIKVNKQELVNSLILLARFNREKFEEVFSNYLESNLVTELSAILSEQVSEDIVANMLDCYDFIIDQYKHTQIMKEVLEELFENYFG